MKINNPRFFSILLAFFCFSYITSCSYFQTIEKTPSIYEDITPEESFRLIQQHLNDKNFIILDIRTPEEISNGYIENATFINYKNDNFAKEISKLDRSNIYLVYCKGGIRSEKAIELMKNLGFRYLYNMPGGFDEWSELHYPFVKP